MSDELSSDIELASRDELLLVLSERARAGNVGAIKALLEELRRDADDSEDAGNGFDALSGDELAQRRRSA